MDKNKIDSSIDREITFPLGPVNKGAMKGTAYLTHHRLLLAISTIWIIHIAFDRLLGYGLKYSTHFKDTHLQHLA